MITLNMKTATVERRVTGDVEDPASWSVPVVKGSPCLMRVAAEIEAMSAGFRLVGDWHVDERDRLLWHMGELR
jgi:hypothetical protein